MSGPPEIPASPAPRRLPAAALLALMLGLGQSDAAWPQVPDNRDVRLDPEDPVSPAYRDTLDERDRQRLHDAREEGHSFMPMFHGAGRAPGAATPGAGPPDSGVAATAAPPREEALRMQRPVTTYESAGRRGVHGGDNGLAEMVGVLLEAWTRPPAIARAALRATGGAGRRRRGPPGGTRRRCGPAAAGPRGRRFLRPHTLRGGLGLSGTRGAGAAAAAARGRRGARRASSGPDSAWCCGSPA